MLKQNLVLTGLDETWPHTGYDLQRAFLSQRPRAEGESMTLESVVERLGIEKNEGVHDALADAVYTAKVCSCIDLDKALAEYPGEEEQLRALTCPEGSRRTDFTLWRGYADGEVWLTDETMRRAMCPECGAPLAPNEGDWWLRKGDVYKRQGVVPAVHDVLFHQFPQIALAHHRVGHVQPRELTLDGEGAQMQVVDDPLVQRPVVLELQAAHAVGDALDGVLDGVGKVVHRVDAPLVALPMMLGVLDAVDGRVAQVHVCLLYTSTR